MYTEQDGRLAADEFFDALQNARLVVSAEAYYRSMFLSGVSAWNIRERHMAETLGAVAGHLQRREKRPAKTLVWAHNAHIGDARATQTGARGELTLGQLVRKRHDGAALLVGFTTHHGTVTAASSWDGPVERKPVRPAEPGSYEAIFHDTGLSGFVLDLRGGGATDALRGSRLERTIGVIYRPETERQQFYLEARLAEEFDAVVHLDETRAVEPLDRGARWRQGEVPDTFPFGV